MVNRQIVNKVKIIKPIILTLDGMIQKEKIPIVNSESVKLAFLILEIHPNSGQTYNIAEIIKYLHSVHPDWDVSIITHKIHYPLVEGINDIRVKIIKVDQYYSSMLFKKKLANNLKDFDILYVKGISPYVFPAKKTGLPIILTVHQMDSIKLFKSVKRKLKIMATNLLTGYIMKKADVVVTVSDELGSFYEKQFSRRIKVIPDQISNIFFASAWRKDLDRSQEIKLLTVGNWDGPKGRKRHDILLNYFANAIKSLPKLRISMVGLSDDNIKELGLLCRDLQLNDYVTLKGYLKEEDLIKEYLNCHIYTTATTYEGFYRQLVEGFATGMPGLVYDSRKIIKEISNCASVNHVLKSKAGILYFDSQSFITAINTIVNNYHEYSIKALNYAKLFSNEIIGRETEELLVSMTFHQNV